MIVPFRYTLSDRNRHSDSVEMKQLAPFQETVIFIVTLGHCAPLDWRHIIRVPVRAWHSQLWLPIQRYLQRSIVSLCCENTVVENKQQQGTEQTVKRLLPLKQPLHLEAKMGHSHTRPTEVAPFGAMPPDPRTVCARRLAEPSPRLCCHHQHFSYPERAMSYSPPYSPSLFKRPDRR